MALYDDASFIFLASGAAGKETDDASKAYSVKPTNGNGDFTISRSDNLNATRVGPTGLIEKGRENLVPYSNQFDQAYASGGWAKNRVAQTSGQLGYDGSNNAFLITVNDVSNVASIVPNDITLTNLVTTSIFAKANSLTGGSGSNPQNTIRLSLKEFVTGSDPQVNVNSRAFFNLKDGTLGSTFENCIASSIEPAGNGFFRCSATFNIPSTNTVSRPDFFLGNGDTTIDSNTIGDSIFIQDFQVEVGLAATDVITTGASTATAGIKEDEPRFDYPLAGGAPSLLIEPQRINKVPHSEYFGGWSASNLTVTNNDIITPEGVKNGAKLLASGSGTVNHQIDTPSFNVTSGAVTASIFAKKGNTDFVRLRLNGTSSEIRAWFNLSSGAVGTVDTGGTGTITDMGDGWHKCTVTEAGNTNTTGMALVTGLLLRGALTLYQRLRTELRWAHLSLCFLKP